jgi:hypothetical protein
MPTRATGRILRVRTANPPGPDLALSPGRGSVPDSLFPLEETMFAKIFPHNEHVADRAIRVILGLVLLSLVFFGPRTAWGWVGLLPLVTGLVGDCPLYTVLGLSTCPRNERA